MHTPSRQRLVGAGLISLIVLAASNESDAQQSCLSVSPMFQQMAGDGGTRTATVTATSGCQWTVFSEVAWMTIISAESGTGSGSVSYRVQPNPSASSRFGSISIGGIRLTVRQVEGRIGSFTGDLDPDLLWQHQTTGDMAVWMMRATTLVSGFLSRREPDTNLKVVGTGDLDGDGRTERVFQHRVTGESSVWMTTTGDFVPTPLPMSSAGWKIRAVGDLNLDGYADLIWQNETTGRIAAWLMQGATLQNQVVFSPGQVSDTDWKIVAVRDFNGDEQLDLVWQHETQGWVAVWLMNGLQQVRGLAFSPDQVPDTDWKIRGAADYDRDGHTDLVWQHQTNGLIGVWLMNGLALRDGRLFSPGQVSDPDWVIVGPR